MHYIWKYKLDHVAFWVVTILFYALVRKDVISSQSVFYFLTDVAVRNGLIAAACYLNIYYLFDRYFKKDRYWAYGCSLLALLLLYTALQSTYESIFRTNTEGETTGQGFLYNSYYNLSIGIFYIAFTLALVLSKRWYRQQLLLHQVQTEQLQTELKYLKAQMNPHFLFNSINTIYFQIDKSNSEARESLQKFSELLRYQLYECNEDRIPIEREISYLESYVDLQRLRKNSNYKIIFTTDESVRDFCIAPLLLLPFVENAFKHLSNDREGNNIVELNMNRQNGSFFFSVNNSTDTHAKDNNGWGIGLKNVRRRLELLYENRFTLDIQQNASVFSVELQISIS